MPVNESCSCQTSHYNWKQYYISLRPQDRQRRAFRVAFLLALLVAIAVVAANPRVFADEHENHRYVHHEEWKKGERMRDEKDARRGLEAR